MADVPPTFEDIVAPIEAEMTAIADEQMMHAESDAHDQLYVLQLPMRHSLVVELIECWNHCATEGCEDCATELMVWMKEFLNMATVAIHLNQMEEEED